MARVNISMPEDMHRRAKELGLNISQLAQKAVARELEDEALRAKADEYLAELEAENGPITPEEKAEADEWARRVFGHAEEDRRSA